MTDVEPASPTAVDPRSGEVIDLANAPHADLVEAFLILQDHERRAKEWRTAVEDEIVKRADTEQTTFVVGEWQLDIDRGYQRKWDVDDFERTITDIVDRGLARSSGLHAVSDFIGLIKTERKVNGAAAALLLNRLDGEALVELRRCFKWEQKGRARVKVTAPQQLTE
jgi:hypothetical protein